MTISKEGIRKIKASIANIALFLSIFIVLFPLAMPTVSAAGDIYYVGSGAGNDTPYIYVAVEQLASDGDTVRVWPGTYYEYDIDIADTITLESIEGKEVTTIDADHLGTVITISASWVNVTGFTIKNGTYGIYLSTDNNEITNNVVDLNLYSGIFVNGENNSVSYNVITNNTEMFSGWFTAGIRVQKNNNDILWNQCYYNYQHSGISIQNSGHDISNNTLDNNKWGIHLYFESNNNIIYNNTITNNVDGINYGRNSSFNTIDRNNIFYNQYGINIANDNNETIIGNKIENNSIDGIHIIGTNDVDINDNQFNNNGNAALVIFESSSSSSIIIDFKINNNIFNNNANSAIYLESSNYIELENNTISNSHYWGIHLYNANDNWIRNNTIIDAKNENITQKDPSSGILILSSNRNYIYDNPLINNSEYGIRLEDSNWNYINNSYISNNTFGIRLDNSNNNTIHLNNSIMNNAIDGIYLNGTIGSHDNTIEGNNISNNDNIGINISNSRNNMISNNNVLLNNIYGISLENSKDNYFHNNIVNSNTIYGLYIEGDYRNNITENNTFNGGNISYVYNENGNSTTLNNSIQNKIWTSGEKVTNVGRISFIECSYFNVTNNTISNATKGIFLYNSNNITLDNNIIYDIDEYGLFIEGDYRNTITNNTIVNGERVYYYYNQTGNESDPIVIEIPESERPMNATKVSNVGKISVIDSKYMLLRNNNVSYGYFGIFLYGSEELTLWNNTIIDSIDVGLNITMGYNHNISNNNRVRGYYKEWDNISYFRDKHDMTYENYILTARNITNVGKLSFVNCTNITVNNNTLASSVYKGDEKRWVGGYGIFLYSSRNFTITDNELLGNIYSVGVIKSEENNITNCSIGNVNGILFDNASNNSVFQNTFTHYVASSTGIRITYSNNITISNNNMSSPYQQGSRGIQFTESENINILDNIFRNKQFAILGINSKVQIEDNFITDVKIAIFGLAGSDNSTKIKNNEIINVTGNGAIYIGVSGKASPAIEGNIISNVHRSSDDEGDGIDIYHHDSAPYVYNNTIFDTGTMGIQLEDSNATIVKNKIYDVAQGINVNSQPRTYYYETYSNTKILNNEIWNCTRKSPMAYWGDGIIISVYNIAYIFNNTIYNCEDYGIHARANSYPYISNNNVSYNKIGIRLETFESNLTILNNTLIGNSAHGIYTQNSDESLIIDNNTFMNNNDGILTSNSDALITNNTFLSNQNGIYVVNGGSPTIQNNTIYWTNLYGIFGQESSPKVQWNTFRNLENRTGGISSYFYACSNETNVTNNTYINSHRAIYLMYSPALVRDNNITLVEGLIKGLSFIDTVGVAVYHQSNATVINNTINGGDIGMGIEYDSNAVIDNNSITYSNYYGIFTRNLNGTTIMKNDILNCGYGIYLRYSSSINISNNTLLENGIFIDGDQLRHWNTHFINTSNSVNGNSIYYWKNQTGGIIPSGAGEVILANCTNVTVENQELNNCSVGIEIGFSTNNNITGNNASYNYYGIYIYNSSMLNLANNNMTQDGIFIDGGLLEHWNTHNINISNVVNNKPVYYWKNQTSGQIPLGAGEVILANCTNVSVQTQELINTSVGIELGFSSNIDINNSNTSNNIYGIFLSNSNQNTITNNIMSDSNFGISLYNSSNNMLVASNASSNLYHGFSLKKSDRNIISCNFTLNNIYGIYLTDSDYNNITFSNITSNYCGIYLLNSNKNNISNNLANSNDFEGIYLYISMENDITFNNASNNYYGIRIEESSNNSILNNSGFFNKYGIYLDSSLENNITSNDVYYNDYGIYLISSDVNNITSNEAILNDYGIYITSSDDNTLLSNNATINDYGIHIEYSFRNIITSNNASNNDHGVYIHNSNDTIITNCSITQNDYYGITILNSNKTKIGICNLSFNQEGIRMSLSNYSMITNNNLFNNTDYGIQLSNSENNSMIDNSLYYNLIGIDISETNKNNTLYHNNFNNTNTNAIDNGSDNQWDNGLEGNWWSDNPDFTDSDDNGICDSNYTGANFIDNYPLANEDNDRVLVDDPWFWFIQSGINFAQSNWSVYATASTYLENVTVNKTVSISGEEKDITIIDGRESENVLFINNTNGVNVSGFTITNGSHGIHVKNSNYCVIQDNNITDNDYGIFSNQSSFLTIQNNYINWSSQIGINAIDSSPIIERNSFRNKEDRTGGTTSYLYNCSNTSIIANNTYINSFRAIYLRYTSCLVENNNISLVIGNIHTDDSVGIAVYHQSNATVINNTIYATDSGIRIEYDSNANIIKNRIENASHHGIFIRDASPLIYRNILESNRNGTRITQGSSPIIRENWINWSGWYGIYTDDSSPLVEWNIFRNLENRTGGITSYFYNCTNSTIIANNTYINSHRAIYLMYSHAHISDNNISLVTGNSSRDDTCGIAVYHQSNATVINNTINDGDSGIRVEYDSNTTVVNNNITNTSYYGIFTRNITNSDFSKNELFKNDVGINLNYSSNITIKYNIIFDSISYGIYVNYSNDNLIYHNNFINNSVHAYDTGFSTLWYNGYPIGGNYWDDYTGVDLNCTPFQNVPPPDGIGDTPYFIGPFNLDVYPLMNPLVNNRIQRPPIRIDSNSDFDSSHGVSSGSGTILDPWVIENYDINGSGYGYCIYIGNTSDYFEVRGSYLHDASRDVGFPQTSDSGIILNNVENGTIKDNIASSNEKQGIYLTSSSFITIENNICDSNMEEGIELYNDCDNNSIVENIATNNYYGIYNYKSDGNNISANYVTDNYWGIWVSDSSNNNVNNNNASSNTDVGIDLWFEENTNIDNNTIIDNYWGIILVASEEIEITENELSNNYEGILIWSSSNNNFISGNNISSCNGTGIDIYDSSDYNEIDNNDIYDNEYGIFISTSDNINITDNLILNNNDCGIYINQSLNIIVEDNSIFENYNGINTYNSSPIIRFNNISFNNKSGIGDVHYSNAIIGNNTITNNVFAGIADVHFSNSMINNNTISFNYIGILCLDNSSSIVTYNNITYNDNGIDSYTLSNASIHWNNIHNNTNKSIRNFDENINISAWYNYWGSDPPDDNDFYGPVDYRYHEANPIEEAGPQ